MKRIVGSPAARLPVAAAISVLALGGAFACGDASSDPVEPGESTLADAAGDGAAPDGPVTTETPPPAPAPSPEGNVVTYAATSLGLDAFSANGRVQPHGAPMAYYFEYGPTAAYGSKTPAKALAPKLAAFYRESYDLGAGGFRGGSGDGLKWNAQGGVSGGFVRYTEPTGNDYNHQDGVGIIHLIEYFYPGIFSDEFAPSAALGGTDPDLRDAKVKVSVRGTAWKPSGTELVWWSQIDVTHGKPPPDKDPAYSNWAHTGFNLTDGLFSGSWETVQYRLYNDTTDWTYAGTNRELNSEIDRSVYVYAPLDDVLTHLDIDFFHVLAFADPYHPSTGSIDFDDFELAYRNHNVLLPSNGGTLASAPTGSDNPQTLTDGWRNGAGKTWKSGPSPQAPVELVFDLKKPVLVDRVELHQNPDFPSKDVEVLASSNGVDWTPIVADKLPQSSPLGPNFAYLLTTDISTFLDVPSTKIKVRILSGYTAAAWGLGEIEVFGSGASKQTDDDWYRVNADITGLTKGVTYHYRLVSLHEDGTTERGGDLTYTVPAAPVPEAQTGPATRIASGSAKVEARLNSLGQIGQVSFEYGPTQAYGSSTDVKRVGPEITPRTVVDRIDGLAAGSTVHYRVVLTSPFGTAVGKDLTFVAK